MMNMNSGYSGWSMSNNAVIAYEMGEKPKSKWTKAAMIEEVKDYCLDNDIAYSVNFEKLKKEDMFRKFFEWSSWHHTGKYCNVTDFYAINEEAIDEYFSDAQSLERSE